MAKYDHYVQYIHNVHYICKIHTVKITGESSAARLRRIYAEFGRQADVSIEQISTLLGYADIKTTQKYLTDWLYTITLNSTWRWRPATLRRIDQRSVEMVLFLTAPVRPERFLG